MPKQVFGKQANASHIHTKMPHIRIAFAIAKRLSSLVSVDVLYTSIDSDWVSLIVTNLRGLDRIHVQFVSDRDSPMLVHSLDMEMGVEQEVNWSKI